MIVGVCVHMIRDVQVHIVVYMWGKVDCSVLATGRGDAPRPLNQDGCELEPSRAYNVV